MTEILPNLHWIKGMGSNIYLWTAEKGLVLFDTGMPWDVNRIVNYIGKIGRSPSDLTTILITHADIDHAGGAAAIQEKTGAAVYASQETAEYIQKGKSPPHMPGLMGAIMERLLKYRAVPASTIQHIAEEQPLPGLDDWQVIASPGHTLDHHAFFNRREGILVAGDALDTRQDRLNCSREQISADMDAARKSARQLLRLTPVVFACGHGKPMMSHEAGDIVLLDRALTNVQ